MNIRADLLDKLNRLANRHNIDPNDLLDKWIKSELEHETPETYADALVSITESGKIVGFNIHAEQIFGYSESEILGYPITMLWADSIKHLRQTHDLQNALDTTKKIQARHKEGNLLVLEVSVREASDHPDATYQIILRETLKVDILQQLNDQNDHLRLLINNVIDMIALHASDGMYEFVSQSCLRLTGYLPAELIGTNPYDYVHPKDVEYVQQAHRIAAAGASIDSTIFRYKHKQGHYI